MELLVSGGATTETLEALAMVAKINKEEPLGQEMPPAFNPGFLMDPALFHSFATETKMVIAIRADKGTPLENLPLGLSARLVSEAVILAY